MNSKLRNLMLVWIALWIALVAALYVYWHALPKALAWALALLDILLVPDSRTLKRVLVNDKALEHPVAKHESEKR